MSRSRAAITAAIALVIGVLATLYVPTADQSHPGFWLLIGLCYSAALSGAILAYQPMRLVMDVEGFYLSGPFRRKQAKDRKVLWRNVEGFTVQVVPGLHGRTKRYVAYRFKAGAYQPPRVIGAMNKLLNPILNPDEKYYISMIWPRSEATIVDELNDYHRRALA